MILVWYRVSIFTFLGSSQESNTILIYFLQIWTPYFAVYSFTRLKSLTVSVSKMRVVEKHKIT